MPSTHDSGLLFLSVVLVAACATGLETEGDPGTVAPNSTEGGTSGGARGGATAGSGGSGGGTTSGFNGGTSGTTGERAGTTGGNPGTTGGNPGTTGGTSTGGSTGTTGGTSTGGSTGTTGGSTGGSTGTTGGSTGGSTGATGGSTGGSTGTTGGSTGTTGGSTGTTGGSTGGTAAVPSCLVISEYLEGASNDKALELWNRCTGSLALGSFRLCLESNTGTTCGRDAALAGTLAGGDVLVVCSSGFASSRCDVTSSAIDFNGNDRVGLYFDTNGNGSVDRGSDQLVDAFGRLGANPPAGVVGGGANPWADVDLRRKTCARFLATADFDASALYTTATYSDESNLGVAPALTCP